MRRTPPLILGAGPAGCAAAIVLAENGVRPVLIDRDAEARDQLCGGFLSWRTVQQLRDLGVRPDALGATSIDRVALVAGRREVVAPLPERAFAVSRRALDGALRERAIRAGARIEIDAARGLEGHEIVGRHRRWSGNGLLLATGKHDLRGAGRPRVARDPALGLRLRLKPSPHHTPFSRRIELHLFPGGYAGIATQEDGAANVCLAVRKSLLRGSGAPDQLLSRLAADHPQFAARLGGGWQSAAIDTIGAVPYGWIARSAEPGVFRLGDQAAVIPSLAGEGMAIALASGVLAARTWLEQGAEGAVQFQRRMAAKVAAPVGVAALARSIAERPALAGAGLAAADRFPSILRHLIHASRIAPEAPLAPAAVAP